VFYAAKRQFDGKRHVLTGWLRDLEGGSDVGNFRWGGTQSLPREVFAGPDGALHTRPVPEVREPYSRTVLELANRPTPTTLDAAGKPAKSPEPWRYEGRSLVAESDGLTRARFDVPADYHLDLTVRLSGPDARFALALRQQEARDNHYRLEVRPAKGEATLAGPNSDYVRPVTFAPGEDVRIEAFVQGSIIECFINDSHAFSGRAYQRTSGPLDLLVMGGKAEIRTMVVKVVPPIARTPPRSP
jgi:sucrose-6-phosphate hydrolase SacC (GH32 family)